VAGSEDAVFYKSTRIEYNAGSERDYRRLPETPNGEHTHSPAEGGAGVPGKADRLPHGRIIVDTRE
jgi:hypothetical protein